MENTYADRQGMTVCTSCVANSVSPVGSVSIWNCTCNAGYKGPTYEETISHENFARSCGLGRSSACVATQSSTFKAQVVVGVFDFINHASLVNDNMSSTLSMTTYASNAWWRVDFERRITVHNVSILYDTFSTDMLHVWKIWSRSSLVLKDLLVGTELILLCGPRYFGIWRKRTRSCVDGEDGIG